MLGLYRTFYTETDGTVVFTEEYVITLDESTALFMEQGTFVTAHNDFFNWKHELKEWLELFTLRVEF